MAPPVANHDSARRIMLIMKKLMQTHTGRLAFDEICKELEISERTLRRYVSNVFTDVMGDVITIKRAEELGIDKPRKKFLCIDKYKLENRTGFQLAPLYLSNFMLSFLKGTFFTEELEETIELFRQFTTDLEKGHHYGDIGNKFYAVATGPKSYADKERIIDRLLNALIRQVECTIEYENIRTGEVKEHRLKPLTMVVYKQGLYVLAQVEGFDRHPFFAVERMLSATLHPETSFSYPRRFNPREYISGSFGIYNEGITEDVIVEFSPQVAVFVEARQWHPSQRLEATEDGGCRLSVTVNGLNEIYSWILGFGKEARVIAPEKLRLRIAEDVREMHREYIGKE